MIKTVFKEIIITLLLCIAILLILGIIFYDYNPMNKIVPSKIAYSTPENIQNEIQEENVEDILDSGLNIVYSIEGSDLTKYKKSNSYVPGKENPFSETPTATEKTEGEGETTDQITDTNKPKPTTTTKNENSDSTGTFLNNTGKK